MSDRSVYFVPVEAIVRVWRRGTRSLCDGMRSLLPSEQGTSLIETAMVLPILLSTIFALVEFSMLLLNQLAVSNGVRSAAHFAATSAHAWSNASPITDRSKIEGWVQPFTNSITNNDTNIVISYLDGTTGATCGQYSQASNAFVPVGAATQATCVIKRNLIKVQANYTYTFISFPFVALFPNGVGLHPSAIVVEEN